MSGETSLNEILSQVRKADNLTRIYIPTQKTEVDFRPLTLAQQKAVIDKVSITSNGVIDFFNNVFEIIKQNCVSDYKKFNTIDRVNIVLHFRKNLSENYQDINLNSLLEKNKTIAIPPLEQNLSTDAFTFEVSAPSLIIDQRHNSYVANNYKDEKELLGKLMVNEVCKFVNKMTIHNSNNTIDFTNQTIKNKITIMESVNTAHLLPVFNYITQIRNVEQEFVKFDDKQIDIGPEIFIL